MTPDTLPAPLSGDLSELSALLHSLAAVADWASFCEKLQQGLARLLPATRLDIYTIGEQASFELFFTSDIAQSAQPASLASSAELRTWFEQQGYQYSIVLPLIAAGRQNGWLALAQVRSACAALLYTLADQLAPLIALRLQYELLQGDLLKSAAQIGSMERHLNITDTLRLRAVLATGTAHDIGNIFTTVIGHAQLLQQDVPESFQSDVRMILRAAEDGRFLLRRLQSATPHFEASATKPTALAMVIDDVIQLTRPIWDRPEQPISIRTIIHDTPLVYARAVELREVLTNLIMNAIAAMANGGLITISCAIEDDRAVVAVADTGHGIALEYQNDIFQPMASGRTHGSGLGLSVSRAIIEGYGGMLTVISAPGEGATFSLTLPAVQRDRAVSRA